MAESVAPALAGYYRQMDFSGRQRAQQIQEQNALAQMYERAREFQESQAVRQVFANSGGAAGTDVLKQLYAVSPKLAMQYEGVLQKDREDYGHDVKFTDDQTPYMAGNRGGIKVLPGGVTPPAPNLHFIDQGNQVQGVDPRTAKPVGTPTGKTQTPGEAANLMWKMYQFGNLSREKQIELQQAAQRLGVSIAELDWNTGQVPSPSAVGPANVPGGIPPNFFPGMTMPGAPAPAASPAPVAPGADNPSDLQSRLRVPPEVQRARDQERLALIEAEAGRFPNDVNLQKEVATLRAQLGGGATAPVGPRTAQPFSPAEAPNPNSPRGVPTIDDPRVSPKRKQELVTDQATETHRLGQINTQLKLMRDQAASLIQAPLGGVTGWGTPLRYVPGTPTANAGTELTSLTAKTIVNTLQMMREMSKTGGALGQVSNYEDKLLSNVNAAINNALQSPDHLRKELQKLVDYSDEAIGRMEGAYQQTYGRFPQNYQSMRAPKEQAPGRPAQLTVPFNGPVDLNQQGGAAAAGGPGYSVIKRY